MSFPRPSTARSRVRIGCGVGGTASMDLSEVSSWTRHETLERECRRNTAGEFSGCRERASGLRGDTSRTGAHRLLSWPKSVLSWTIGPRRCQSARAIRRRVVSGNYRNRPSETQTTSATIKAQTIPARPAGDRKNFDHAPPTFDLISPNPGQPNNRGSNQDRSSVSLSSARRVIGIK